MLVENKISQAVVENEIFETVVENKTSQIKNLPLVENRK